MSSSRFQGEVVVITGAARGIGRACAERFVTEGAAVALLDRDARALQAAAEDLSRAGARCRPLLVDVTDDDAVADSVAQVVDTLGVPGVLVANAGVVHTAEAGHETHEGFRRLLDVNVAGVLLIVRACLPHVLERRGAIVVTSSMSALLGEPGLLAYCTSKAALLGMVHQLSTDYAPRGVRVNAVCPGWVDTGFGMTGVPRDDIDRAVARQVPLGRQAAPAEIASCIAFLASADASYVTGQALVVDGGVTTTLR
jgi:NAD(P)-dependent dehydrogenase (short-subunit alcohol dehydrogenase family)